MHKEKRTLKMQGLGMIAVLLIQYVLGIFSNLFIQFPQGEKDGQLWEFAWRQLPLALHIIVGILLLIGSIVFIIRSILLKDTTWIIVSTISCIAILLAGVSGAIFIPSQSNIYSLSMAIFFIVALFSYFWGVYQS